MITNSINRKWVHDAVEAIHADAHRSVDTNLHKFTLPKRFEERGVALYLKDESRHPTGSLKHRLARSLFLYALCNGKLPNADTKVFEASSGSTAISEAYFANLIGLKTFVAVIPKGTSPAKLALIRKYGGKVLETKNNIVKEAASTAKREGGYFMDQFTYSERATDWRGNNNIAEVIFEQMESEKYRIPKWIVCGAGTGGTSATIGRYARYRGFETRVCVVDPYGESVYFDAWSKARGRKNFRTHDKKKLSTIEGIGRPTRAGSFLSEVIDAMISVSNDASIGAMQYLAETGRYEHGPSTGTNFFGSLLVLQRMLERGEQGAVVTLLCDSAERYKTTYCRKKWLREQVHHDETCAFNPSAVMAYKKAIKAFAEKGINIDQSLLTDRMVEDFAFD